MVKRRGERRGGRKGMRGRGEVRRKKRGVGGSEKRRENMEENGQRKEEEGRFFVVVVKQLPLQNVDPGSLFQATKDPENRWPWCLLAGTFSSHTSGWLSKHLHQCHVLYSNVLM